MASATSHEVLSVLEPGPITTPSSRLVDAVDRLVRTAVGLTAVALENHGEGPDLTLHQWRALVLTAEAGAAGLRVGQIARRLDLALPGASRLVARLEGRGLVHTERDPRDRRATVVRPTSAGEDLWEKVLDRRRRRIAAAIEASGVGPQDHAVEALEKLMQGLAPYS